VQSLACQIFRPLAGFLSLVRHAYLADTSTLEVRHIQQCCHSLDNPCRRLVFCIIAVLASASPDCGRFSMFTHFKQRQARGDRIVGRSRAVESGETLTDSHAASRVYVDSDDDSLCSCNNMLPCFGLAHFLRQRADFGGRHL
jgi:hypothetical protein